ncbi:hypothetical protein [Streptomyces sp. NBC_00344]|uniref:hypothetical protein n=1 Tax=Streptomyces sp. NBC_00344 TaxID=2975720 RepID=UPI002E21F3D1
MSAPAPVPPPVQLMSARAPAVQNTASATAPRGGADASPVSSQGGGPVRRGVDDRRFSGVAEAFPALPVQRAATPPVPDGAPPGNAAPVRPLSGTARQDAPVVTPRAAAAAPPVALPVQRAPGTPSSHAPAPPRLLKPATPAAPVVSPVTVPAGGTGSGGNSGAPPPYTERAESPPPYSRRPPPRNSNGGTRHVRSQDGPGAGFDARKLSDGQVDELTHRLIGPLTRLLRTELRMDRERIGRLRDPRR